MRKIASILAALILLASQAAAQTGTWSGKLEVQGISLGIVFHLDGDECTVDSPDQGVKGIPAEYTTDGFGKLVVKVPSLGATFEGLSLGTQIIGTFSQNGVSFPLVLTPGEVRLNRPQTPQPPFPYSTEEVTFSNGDAVLKGTLVIPEGCTRRTPVFVMVTGSGLQNRDEEIFEHKPFAVIADALARAGFATLRYDDRGFGESTGDAVFCTTEDLKDDALAGITLMRDRFDKVGVIGHSEGGTIALMLAAEGKVDYAVSLAGMIVSGKELLLWQNRELLAASSLGDDAVDGYCKLLEEAFEATLAGTPLPQAADKGLPDALARNYQAVAAQLGSPYMKYFLGLDARTVLDKVQCPVLALNGTRDTQVECKGNLDALRKGLPGNPLNQVEEVEGVNHLFQHCTTGASSEYREIEETFAPEALAKIVTWARKADIFQEKGPFTNHPLPSRPDTLRILAVGNSFSDDGTEYLPALLKAAGIDNVIIGRLYIGGCSLERHCKEYFEGRHAYTYSKSVSNRWEKLSSEASLTDGLKDEPWDVITLQETSGLSGIYDSFGEWLPRLIAIVRKEALNPKASIVWHQTWAYASNSDHKLFAGYGRDQQKMYDSILDCVSKLKKDFGIDVVIPSGTAIQLARKSSLNDPAAEGTKAAEMTRDGYHLNRKTGRYTAACTWFEALLKPTLGKSVTGNPCTLKDTEYGISVKEARLCQECAAEAVKQ